MSEFWLLSDGFQRSALRVSPKGTINGNDVWYAREVPVTPLVFEVVEGKRITDLVGSSDLHPPLISKKFEELLLNGFTGWKTLPCVVDARKGSVPPDTYSVLTIPGRCGHILVERSLKVQAFNSDGRMMPGKFEHLGVFFDEADWDGSDIFLPRTGPSRAIITHRLRDAIVSARLTNVDLESAETKRTPYGYL